jgi:hypothetical protein
MDGCKLHFLTVLGCPYDFDLTDYFIGLIVHPVIVWDFRPVSKGIQLLRAYPLRRVSHSGAHSLKAQSYWIEVKLSGRPASQVIELYAESVGPNNAFSIEVSDGSENSHQTISDSKPYGIDKSPSRRKLRALGVRKGTIPTDSAAVDETISHRSGEFGNP